MEPITPGLIIMLVGVLTIPAVGIPYIRMGARGELARNSWSGIRTKHTKISDAAWQAGHAAALPLASTTMWIALITIVLAIAVGLSAGEQQGALVGVIGLTGETVVLLLASRKADQAARVALNG